MFILNTFFLSLFHINLIQARQSKELYSSIKSKYTTISTETSEYVQYGCKGLEGENKTIISNTGTFLGSCFDCALAYQHMISASVHYKEESAATAWTFESFGEKCLIHNSQGYASVCKNCFKFSNQSHPVFLLKSKYTWVVEKHGDLYAFKAKNGQYMYRCSNCVKDGFESFAFADSKTVTEAALWKVRPCANCVRTTESTAFSKIGTQTDGSTPATTKDNTAPQTKPSQPKPESGCKGLEGGFKHIISDIGTQLARCLNCGYSIGNNNTVGVHGQKSDQIYKSWTFEPIGSKCALKTDFGYASRCNGCWEGTSILDSVFIVNQAVLWEVEKHGDGYAFKADTGKYMARCRGCVPEAAIDDLAFVHADSPYIWKIENA